MDGYRVRQLLIVAAAIALGATLWFLPRAASFITPSPPAPIELQAAPTPTDDRGTSRGVPAERADEPAPGGNNADDGEARASGAAIGASARDTDDDRDDVRGGSGASASGADDDDRDDDDGDDDGDDD